MQKLTPTDIDTMRAQRAGGATYVEIARSFDVHHTTVMHHLDKLGGVGRWPWVMSPGDIRTALLMRDAKASIGEIARRLHYTRQTVRNTLKSEVAMRDYQRWLREHPVGPPPSDTAA